MNPAPRDVSDQPDAAAVAGVIARRRTVRRFDPDRPVPDRLLHRILELAALAPSPFNLQPWRFVVVRDPANRKRLRGCAGNDPRIVQAPINVIILGYRDAARTHLEAVLETAMAANALTREEAAEHRGRVRALEGRGDRLSTWSDRAAMLAAATLMLAAEAHGLGSALLMVTASDPIRDAFGIPDDHVVCGLVALGYPAEPAPFPGRLDLNELCHGEQFGPPLVLRDEP